MLEGTKLSALTPVTTVEDTDEFYVGRSGQQNKITGANLKAASGGSVPFVGATAPSSPTDGELWWDTDDATSVGGSITPPVTLTGTDPAIAVLTLRPADGATEDGNSVFAIQDDTGFERWDIDAAGHSEYRTAIGGHVSIDPTGYVLIGGDTATLTTNNLDAVLNVGAEGVTPGTIASQLLVAVPGSQGCGVRVQAGQTTDASLQVLALTDQTAPLVECRDLDFNLVFSIGPTGALTVTVPTSDPHVAGQVWNNSGALMISAG